MIVKIHKPSKGSKNTGSAGSLIDYLEKENTNLEQIDYENFFNHDSNIISAAEAKNVLDGNKHKLSKDETKFYMLTVNPSKKELNHIGNDREKLQDYVKNVMDIYADNFNRFYNNGEKLQGKDLVYYAKIETSRTYRFNEKQYRKEMEYNKTISEEIYKIVIEKQKTQNPQKRLELDTKRNTLENQYKRNSNGVIIKEGNQKDGINTHVHIVVHRYDKQKKFKLSPLANARNTKNKEVGLAEQRRNVQAGFDRDKFVGLCEQKFDKQFNYNRSRDESYKYRKSIKGIRNTITAITNPKAYAKTLVKRAIIEMIDNKSLQKTLNMATKDPKRIPERTLRKIEQKAVEKIVKNVVSNPANINPVVASINMAKQVVTAVSKQISKGIGI